MNPDTQPPEIKTGRIGAGDDAHSAIAGGAPHCPFPLPAGVTYDGPMDPPRGERIHLFTDRAQTRGTFAVVAARFNAAAVAEELAMQRAKFREAVRDTCICLVSHGGPVDARHCGCPRCRQEVHARRKSPRITMAPGPVLLRQEVLS
jgi:hypothetical protein